MRYVVGAVITLLVLIGASLGPARAGHNGPHTVVLGAAADRVDRAVRDVLAIPTYVLNGRGQPRLFYFNQAPHNKGGRDPSTTFVDRSTIAVEYAVTPRTERDSILTLRVTPARSAGGAAREIVQIEDDILYELAAQIEYRLMTMER